MEGGFFYPAARDAGVQSDFLDPSEDLFDAKVKVLGEYIDHHVQQVRRWPSGQRP